MTNKKVEAGLKYLKDNNYRRVDLIVLVKMKENWTLRNLIGYYLRHWFELCLVGCKEDNKVKIKKIFKAHTAGNVILADIRE